MRRLIIDITTREVFYGAITTNPTGAWSTQAARNLFLRRELLDRTIIWNQHQLQQLVSDYIAHYNTHRPHRSLNQRPPAPTLPPSASGQQLRIVRATRCGGLVNEYRRAA